ncbi:MAG: hypothetical protein GU356_12050 [Pyrobaculum sp.]|jgi:hypothetical protein|nr:hypothetical protein [Pyrobaculum sp.]
MYDVGLVILIILAALVMLIRGDPKWTLPALIGAFVLFLVPMVTMYTIAFFTPGRELPPLFEVRQGEFFPYPYPDALNLQQALERNYKKIHETYEGLRTAQELSAGAVFAVAYTETILLIVGTVTGGAPAAIIQLSKFAAYFSKVGDPLLQIALTAYNAVTAFVMIFHFLEFMAGLAVKMAVPLLALSLFAVIFGPTRALGGALLFFALIMIVPSYIGYYLAPLGKEFATWGVETAKWLNATAVNATGIAPVPLIAVEGAPHTLFLGRYNNTFVLKSPDEIAAKINQTLGLHNITTSKDAIAAALELAKRYKVFDKAAFNGTDWVTATAGSITPIAYGNKTWLYTTAINTWLDFPAPAPQEGGCVQHGDFREFIDYLAPPEEAQRLKERVDNLTRAICQYHEWLGYRSYFLQIDVPAHWRLLTVTVNYTAKDRHGVVDKGITYAHNGVWGWLSGPDNETCFNALGNKSNCAALDTTVRVGRYNFSLWSGEKQVINPITDRVRSEFSFAVRNSSQPVFGRSVSLHRWVETCEWCCEYENGTCVQWCSSSRDVWQRANVTKRLGEDRYRYNTTVYARPWVPEEEKNYTGRIPVTTRTWNVEIWLDYGEWSGDAPPSDASCQTSDNRTYMVLSFFRAVPGPPRVLYAFTWMDSVGVLFHSRRGGSLPDILANYTDTDGVRVVEYLEGVEHQYYCYADFVPTAEPRWRPVVDAERNLTKLLKDNYLNLIIIRNVSLAYFARVGPYLAAAEASNSSLAKATAASVREFLALLNKTPGAAPLYYTRPNSYRGMNVIIACVMYDWRAPVNLTAELRLHPAREWWVASYPMGDSRVARHVAEAKADMFKYVFGTPPPPPPANLSGYVKQWRIPWNNRTLPYKPYYSSDMKMPPRDNETGIPLWNIQYLEDVQTTQSNVLSWLFTVLFVTILSIVAVFEFLGALFDFPTPMREVYGFVIGVIQDWTYWLPFRVAVRGRLLQRVWLAVKRPVMRRTVRVAARVHSFFASRIPGLRRIRSPDLKEYYRRYILWRREIAIKDPADQIREEIKTKARQDALERVRRAAEERADAEWVRNWRRRAEEEEKTRRETFEKIKRIFNAGDIIEVLRELSPRFDAWVQERVEASRGSWSYHLFWWRQDRIPYIWRVLLNLDPHVVARLVAEGKIKPEDAALYLNLRAAVEAHVRELRWGWARLHTVSQYVKMAEEEFEKARQKMVHEAEKGLADFRRFAAEFQRHFEVLRRYFTEDLSKLDEGERRRLEEAAKSVTERLNEAIRHFAVIDKAPRARVVSALNEALQRAAEGKAPLIPRDASVEGVVKHLALMDLETAVKVLRSAERFLEAHYAVAPTRYDTRQIAAEVVKWKIEEQLPTLKLAGAARGIVLGGRSAEEGEALLKAWKPRDPHGLVAVAVHGFATVVDVYVERPWEAVAYRFSYIRERPLEVREAFRIKSDVVLTTEYAKYLAGFRAEEKALEILRKAVEYRRIMHMLERAEELRLTPLAVERLTADAERLRQEVLQETAEIYRRFREEFFFVKDLLEGHRVVRREVPEVREVVKAFEDAVAEALKAPQRRERVFREVFVERVERLVEEYMKRQDVEAVERIRRAATEIAKISESAGWRAVEDVALVLPTVAKAFDEALKAVSQSRDFSRFAEAFKAKAEEAAKQLEQQGMSDAAARVRKAADKIAEEVYFGGRWAVERLRPLLLPEHSGDVLSRLEFLHTIFTTETLGTYRELVYLRQVEGMVNEVKGLASAPGVAEEALRKAAEAVPAVKDTAVKAEAALRDRRWAEAAELLSLVKGVAEENNRQAADVVRGVEEAVDLGRKAAEYGRRVSELLPRAEALNADEVKPALEAAVNRDYGRALVLIEAAEKSINEKIAAVRDVEPLAKTLERLGIDATRLSSPEYRQRAVKEVEEAVAAMRGLADLPTAVQRDAEKVAKAAEAFVMAETASLFRAVEKVRKEAGDAYPIFTKALAEALRAPEGDRAEVFRRVFTAETEKMVKAFEERGLKTEAENLRKASETALKISETVGWKAPEEITQRLPSAVAEAERLIAKLRDEAAVRQISEYGYYSALASLAREAKEVVTAKRDVEEKLAKLIDDVKPAVDLIAPHLTPLLEKVKAGDYSVLPALEAELPKLVERHRQLQVLVNELEKARKSLDAAARIGEKIKQLEDALKKTPEDVKAVFNEAFKALERRDFEKASKELDKILKIVEEKRERLQPLEREVREVKALAEQLGLEKVVKALEKPTEKNVAKALGELERELARLYGALELVEYVKRPRADADFGHAWGAARVLGLEEVDKLFRALSEISLYQLREGREIFRNPLYDEVKHLIDQEWVRSLVKAPMYSYIVDRLGPDVLQPTYARWYGLFVEYGPYLNTAYEHARTSAVVARAPVGITGGFSYADKMMRWLGDFSQEAVMRGLKAYYRGEGRPFRELSEMTVIGAKIQLFDKAASVLMAKATQMLSEAGAASDEAVAKRLMTEAEELRLLAFALRAKAAYEEVRLVQTYLKGVQRRAEALLREAERERDTEKRTALKIKAREMLEAAQRKAEKHIADARASYKAHLAEIKDFIGAHGDVREVGMKYFGLTARAFAGDPEAVAERMIRAVDVRRIISWADELKLPKELGEIAVRITDAGRIYAKFEKILRAKVEPIPPVYDLEKAGRFFADVRPHPPPPKPRVEEAVPKVVKDVLTAYYGRLREAAERAAVYLALIKNDTRHVSQEVKKAYQALQKALKAKDKEEAPKALEELKAALKTLGIEAQGGDVKAVLKAVEEKLRPAYEEYVKARREYASAVEAIAKFSPEAALALVEAAREGGLDSIGRWMSLVAYEAGRRALEEYARFWARPVEERWDALPPAVRELIAKREEEATYELVRSTLRNAGIGVRRGVEMELQGYEKALERVFTANGEWSELRDYVKQVVEAARRVQRGEASTDELTKAVDELFRAYGAKAAERFVRSDRLEDAVDEMHEGMRHFARETGLRVGREAAERALLLGLSTMPEELVQWYARDSWRGRLEPYVAYWTEDAELARRAGEAGWEVRQIQRPVSFEEGVPKEWRTAYVVAPFGFDLSAVERTVVQLVDGAESGVARIRPVEWPVPEAYLWFVLKDRQPVKDGEWIVAYSIDRLSIEEPLARFREALRSRNFDEMGKVVRQLYEARLNRTLWQIVYEFDRERAEAALEHLRQRYGVSEARLWERHDELYLTWLGFRLADEFEAYLKSGVGRGFKTKEEVAGAVFMPWLPVDLAPLFWLRLVGDPEGEVEFRNAWYTAVDMWFERMAAPHQPKKPAVARKAIELFNVFVGAGFKYEELFPPPQKPEAAKPAEAVKPEAVVKPETAAKPETKPAQKPAVEVVEERGLRREVEKQAARPEAAKPEAVKPTEVKRAEAVRQEVVKPAAEAVEVRGLRQLGERPKAPIADVIPERVEAVDYLLGRFGVVLDREAAFKAKSLVTAKVKARLEKVAVKEPEFAHLLAEVAEHVLSSFGRLMASPDAARHVYNALFYYFEGYQTRDGELLFARIERTVREAVRKAEEAGIPDAEYRVKQFVLEVIDVLARAGERYRRDVLKGISTVEKALRATVFAGLSAAALYSVYSGLYSEAVVSSVASAVALAEVGQFKEAVQYVQKAAKALYEAAKEVFEHVKVTVQRLVELFVEAVTRVLAWIDEHKAYLFLMAAAAAGVIALGVALNLWGLVELEKLAHAAVGAPFVAGLADAGGKAAERFRVVADRWRVDENEKKQKIEEILNAPQKGERPYETLRKLSESTNLPPPLAKLKEALEHVQDEVVQDAAVVAALVLYKTLVKNAESYGEWAELYKWARGLVEKQAFAVAAGDIERLRRSHRRLEEVAEEVRRELNRVLVLYSQSDFYKERPDLLNKLKQHLEVDVKKAEELAEARRDELSKYSNANMGTKAYAALLSTARGGIYGHAATLFMVEGALADVVLLTPGGAYDKAKDVAKGRGEAVDPSYSGRRGRSVGQLGWEDRAASVLLRFLAGYGEAADLKFRRVEKGGRKGFQVFRVYGGVEAFVGELWIGDVARFNVSKEELRRFVEEAKRMAPDLSGVKKIWHVLPWLNTDVSFDRGWIKGATAHTWQAAWYVVLFGEPESISGRANVTEEGIKPNVTMYWRGEVLDSIIAEESKELEPLLRPISKQGGGSREAEGPAVKSWRELVDAIDWSWVLKRVGELVDELKPWIGRKDASDVEREGLVRRMLGELALIAHFAEARRGMDDGKWREERAKRLEEAVEALSDGRIAGEHAERLARAIIYYAEGYKEYAEGLIESLVKEVGISKEEVWGIVEFVLSYMYCLARDCARDEVVRKFVEPALELMMLDKALNNELDREEALLIFGEMYATAVAGDGSVGPDVVVLTVGGELGGGAALLRLATLHLLNQLLPDELKFNARIYVKKDRYYDIATYGENAARLRRLLAMTAPSAGGKYLSEKFNGFVEAAKVEVRLDKSSIRQTEGGNVAADLIISEAGIAVKYNVYLSNDMIRLRFYSTDRSHAELAALLLRHAGVDAEVQKEGNRDMWRIEVTTHTLAAGREELREALAELVREAAAREGIDAGKAERWLKKLEEGRVLMEGWPRYYVGLREGALDVRYHSTSRKNIEQEAQRLRDMGLKEGKHFTVKMPEGGDAGYLYIHKEGLAYAAWLSVHGSEDQRKLAADFVKIILQRAEEACGGMEPCAVYEKAKEIVEEGKAWGSQTPENFEKKVEVNGKTYVVKVKGGEAVEEDRGGRKLLRLKMTAEVGRVEGEHIVDRVVREYTITFSRRGRDNAVLGYATARIDAPGGREADAERLAAVVEALTGKKPRIRRMKDGTIIIECGKEHLEGFKRYAELADVIARWLEETSR